MADNFMYLVKKGSLAETVITAHAGHIKPGAIIFLSEEEIKSLSEDVTLFHIPDNKPANRTDLIGADKANLYP